MLNNISVMSGSGKKSAPDYLPQGDVAIEEEVKKRTQVPRRYQVLLHNDDYTTMDFVVMVLVEIFHHPPERAVQIMLDVHQKGIGVAGVYPFDIAESKARRTMELAREHEFPLRCSVEPE